MKRQRVRQVVASVALLVCGYVPSAATAEDTTPGDSKEAIRIDVPVTLENANVVFVMDHLAFADDTPVGIRYMHLLAKRYGERRIKGQIIGLFFGEAAYLALNDRAYNAYRSVPTGNPYKGPISALMKQGVQIEECAVSMKRHNWSNGDLLPGKPVSRFRCRRIAILAVHFW